MNPRRYYISLTALLITAMLSSSALSVPEQSAKTNFKPRKKKLTIARLIEEYDEPIYHIEYEEETSEIIYGEGHKKFGKIYYDEVIAFKIDGYIVAYYFVEDEFLARVIKGDRDDGKFPKLLP